MEQSNTQAPKILEEDNTSCRIWNESNQLFTVKKNPYHCKKERICNLNCRFSSKKCLVNQWILGVFGEHTIKRGEKGKPNHSVSLLNSRLFWFLLILTACVFFWLVDLASPHKGWERTTLSEGPTSTETMRTSHIQSYFLIPIWKTRIPNGN